MALVHNFAHRKNYNFKKFQRKYPVELNFIGKRCEMAVPARRVTFPSTVLKDVSHDPPKGFPGVLAKALSPLQFIQESLHCLQLQLVHHKVAKYVRQPPS